MFSRARFLRLSLVFEFAGLDCVLTLKVGGLGCDVLDVLIRPLENGWCVWPL